MFICFSQELHQSTAACLDCTEKMKGSGYHPIMFSIYTKQPTRVCYSELGSALCSIFHLINLFYFIWPLSSPSQCFVACSLVTAIFPVRYYFPGWYSCGASRAYRYGVTKGSESPVLDDYVMSYLFAQVRIPHVRFAIKKLPLIVN